ncbi:potassium channel family protein [Shewanella sp. YLB-07]|uniref:potassium channel family protein n=1 Tax=Shewanella sp. YLB-07 TaxID=2601268 RepID=UPI00128AE949|nr:potassium channel family protein [Shewanella sp. YLB-07]MPY24531.1 two pore domain potassium channel family protein [Shewanella sp. YLB-07]
MKNNSLQINKSKPHNKEHLTTEFGRILYSIPYKKLAKVTVLVWLTSVLYFLVTTQISTKHGLDLNTLGCKLSSDGKPICDSIDIFLSSLYFMGVTITTLGYGDILPLGFGRIISVLVAVFGLTVIAILISKVSSERDSSTLLLLHTSDVERRISGFSSDVSTYIKDLKSFSYGKYLKEYEQSLKNTRVKLKSEELSVKLKEFRTLLLISSKYLVFHINQSLSSEIGTNTAVAQFIKQLSEAQDAILDLKPFIKQHENIERACLKISSEICSIEGILLQKPKNNTPAQPSLEKSNLIKKHEDLEKWLRLTYTESWVSKVKNELPNTPRAHWPKHPHKPIATKLGISNSIVSSCIKELIRRREY